VNLILWVFIGSRLQGENVKVYQRTLTPLGVMDETNEEPPKGALKGWKSPSSSFRPWRVLWCLTVGPYLLLTTGRQAVSIFLWPGGQSTFQMKEKIFGM